MKLIISKNLTPLPPSLPLPNPLLRGEGSGKTFVSWKGVFKASPLQGERFGEGFIYTLKTFQTSSLMTFAMRLGIDSQLGYGFYVKLTPMSIVLYPYNLFRLN